MESSAGPCTLPLGREGQGRGTPVPRRNETWEGEPSPKSQGEGEVGALVKTEEGSGGGVGPK